MADTWYDLAKFSDAFQARFHAVADPYAHIEIRPRCFDHLNARGMWATERMNVPGRVLAYLVASHHAGLSGWRREEAGNMALAGRLEKT